MRKQRILVERVMMAAMVAATGMVTSAATTQTPPPLRRAPQCPLNPLSHSYSGPFCQDTEAVGKTQSADASPFIESSPAVAADRVPKYSVAGVW